MCKVLDFVLSDEHIGVTLTVVIAVSLGVSVLYHLSLVS